ncbi:MAG: polysaccharide deacetylase [Frankiales bacterium]|nr:polysaccharide deacetylase [Frankiales bacterium]
MMSDMHDNGPEPGSPPLSRRTLLRGSVVLGVGTAAAGAGLSGGAVAYAETAGRRSRAAAAAHQERMPTSTRLLWQARTDQQAVALTFDDGPDPRYTDQVLDALAAHGARATFFQVGQHAAQHADLVQRVHGAGHEIGNHTWGHDDLSAGDLGQALRTISRTQHVLADVTGQAPSVLRPPWGRINGSTMQAAAEHGLDVMVWSQRLLVRERDAAGNAAWFSEHLSPGVVLLAHDGGSLPNQVGVDALPRILTEATARGYRFVTASELLALDRTAEQKPVAVSSA